MKTVINLNRIEVKTTSRRKYGNQFFAWGEVKYNGNVIDISTDAYPSSKFPMYEGAMEVIKKIEGEKQVIEREFRKLFKGIKEGAKLYADMAEILENRYNVEFI